MVDGVQCVPTIDGMINMLVWCVRDWDLHQENQLSLVMDTELYSWR